MIYLVIAMVALSLIFSLYHFVMQKRRYMTGPHVRRVFDMGTNWRAMLETGSLAALLVVLAGVAYANWPYSLILTLPMGLYLLNWIGKVQANAFLGVLVDSQKGEIIFMRTSDTLDITDYLMVLPALRNYGAMDRVVLADIQWLTRQAGKSVFLHGDFGSRRITFSNKLKRDECIHLITNAGNRIRVTADLEL